MLSRTLGLMFKAKQLFTKKYLLLLQIVLFLVNFNNFEVIRSQSLKVSKNYQKYEVRSIKKLLVVPASFSLYYEIAASHTAIFIIPATLLHQPNLTLTTARNKHAFYNYSYCENAIWQCDPSANIMDIVQYIVLHPLFSTKAFLIKLFKNFQEQVDFFKVSSDSLVKKTRPSSLNLTKPLSSSIYFNVLNVRVIP